MKYFYFKFLKENKIKTFVILNKIQLKRPNNNYSFIIILENKFCKKLL